MKRFLLFFTLLFLSTSTLMATHLMGGEITAIDLGNGQHVVTLIAYRDTIGIPMTQSAALRYEGPNAQNFTRYVQQDSVISGNLLPMYPYGVEIYLFVDTVTFPTSGRWDISWTHCCRNDAIQNLSNPLSESMYLTTSLVIDSLAPNSSPFFLVPAAIFLPLNTSWQYNPLPFDLEGDSLYWSLDRPLDQKATPCAGYTSPSSSATNPFSLDPFTGTISWTANNVGNYVASILVEQFRNGQQVGEIRRDMQFIVVNPLDTLNWGNLSVLPKDSNSQISFNLIAGKSFKVEMIAGHSDPNKQLYMQAYSEVLEKGMGNAAFTVAPAGQQNQIKGTFSWQPNVMDVRKNPYLLVFRASDGLLTDDKTVKLNVTTRIGLGEYDTGNSIGVYPNPAGEQIFIEIASDEEQEVGVEFYNLNGQRVLSDHILTAIEGKSIFILPLDELPHGIYMLQVKKSDGTVHTQKVVVK